MTRQDLNGKLYPEVENVLGENLKEYTDKINEMMTIEELEVAEAELMKEAQEYDEYLNGVEYDLPNNVEYDGDTYSRNEIAKCIISALGKMEVEWQHTLGLFELVNLWKTKDLAKISMKAFDSTLRTLNQVKYKGYTEWRDILAVNKFLSECHNEYSLDTAWNILISEKHNAIMKRAELVRKSDNVVDEQEAVVMD